MPAARAEALLAEVIYERVVEFVDFDAIGDLESELASLYGEQCAPGDDPFAWARAMIERSLARLATDERRLSPASVLDDCELCDAEYAAHAKAARPSARD